MNFPYTYISCPCTDVSTPLDGGNRSRDGDDEEDVERTFDPSISRANFSLFPIEHLLYCEDCQQIRCPRCTIEEVVCWYCPSCIFEVPSSLVKSEGGRWVSSVHSQFIVCLSLMTLYRCYRNCYNCPICMAPLAVNSINPDPGQKTISGPYMMSCGFCNWTTLDIGWQFEKLTNIHQQISKLKIGGNEKSTLTRPSESQTASQPSAELTGDDGHDSIFASLRSFYNSQLSAANPSDPLLTPSGGYNYSSPSSLARIMSLYTGRSFYGKKGQGKPPPMRESADLLEGLRLFDPKSDDEAIEKLRTQGWTSTASISQRTDQQQDPLRFADELRPLRAPLRTKRSKRCRACRHILVKPEAKIQSVRFRIRLIAINYTPLISLKPLQPSPSPSTQVSPIDLNALPASRATQFLLTLKNPLYDPVKITLATPSHTSGRHRHKVTILCPQFDIGANVDQWDEALSNDEARRSSKLLNNTTKTEYASSVDGGKVAEAGKVWDRERNWTTVVVEIVCAIVIDRGDDDKGEAVVAEDEDVVEIPIFVRMEWEAEVERGEGAAGKAEEKREKRELAYWVVVGVGRVQKMKKQSLVGDGPRAVRFSLDP